MLSFVHFVLVYVWRKFWPNWMMKKEMPLHQQREASSTLHHALYFSQGFVVAIGQEDGVLYPRQCYYQNEQHQDEHLKDGVTM